MVSEQKSKNGKSGKAAVIFLTLLVLVGGAGYYYWTRGRVSTDDAYIEGRIYTLSPRVSGYVEEIFVEDDQLVETGQPLLALDTSEFKVALAEARAVEAEARATLASMKLGVPLELNQTAQRVRGARASMERVLQTIQMVQKELEAASHGVVRARVDRKKCLLDLKRMEKLKKSGAAAASDYDGVKTKYEAGQAELRAAIARRDGVAKRLSSLESDLERMEANIVLAASGEDLASIKSSQVEAQQARVDLARARVEQALLDLAHTKLKSPGRGYITRKRIEVGQMVSKGQPLLAVVSLSEEDIWVTANLKETQLTHVRPGQLVDIAVDTYPDLKLKGKVASIMAGTGSAFSLFPPENATGNFVKVVQRVPVKIVFNHEPGDRLPALRLGMSVVVAIRGDDKN